MRRPAGRVTEGGGELLGLTLTKHGSATAARRFQPRRNPQRAGRLRLRRLGLLELAAATRKWPAGAALAPSCSTHHHLPPASAPPRTRGQQTTTHTSHRIASPLAIWHRRSIAHAQHDRGHPGHLRREGQAGACAGAARRLPLLTLRCSRTRPSSSPSSLPATRPRMTPSPSCSPSSAAAPTSSSSACRSRTRRPTVRRSSAPMRCVPGLRCAQQLPVASVC
jgi:hypothetical protein